MELMGKPRAVERVEAIYKWLCFVVFYKRNVWKLSFW